MSNIKRSWSIEEKIAILKDIKKTGVVEGCRKHDIYATTYYGPHLARVFKIRYLN